MTGNKPPSAVWRYVAAWLVTGVFLALLLEGLASFLYVGKRVFQPTVTIGQGYSRYDRELGWTNIPNSYVKDLFGRGVYFRSNAQGFRDNEDFSKTIPQGKFRIICSGDSFAMGYGVDNDHAWCQILSQMDHRLQTVNMGEIAYGIDQSYLWYLRDGTKLNHDLHLFTFIADDFARATYKFHWGYEKPILVVEGNELAVRNVPVPDRGGFLPLVTRALSQFYQLRSITLLGHLLRRFVPSSDAAEDEQARQLQALPVALRIFERLKEMHAQSNQLLALVYLPQESDCLGDPENEALRKLLKADSEKQNTRFWDLTEECQQVPASLLERMFFPAGQVGAFHLTAEGNRLVAGMLYHRMIDTPQIASRIQGIEPPGKGIHPTIIKHMIRQ